MNKSIIFKADIVEGEVGPELVGPAPRVGFPRQSCGQGYVARSFRLFCFALLTYLSQGADETVNRPRSRHTQDRA